MDFCQNLWKTFSFMRISYYCCISIQLLGYYFHTKFLPREQASMNAFSLRVRFFVLSSTLIAGTTLAVASPVSIPPMPSQGKLVASSPVSIPPMPSQGKLVATSPVSIPPMPSQGKLVAS